MIEISAVSAFARIEGGNVPWSVFTVELSVTGPVPEWGGADFRVPLEQDIVFMGEKTIFLDGRQTAFHLIR